MSSYKRQFESEEGEKVVVFNVPVSKCCIVDVKAMFSVGDMGGSHIQAFTVCGNKAHAGQNTGFANRLGAEIEFKHGAIVAKSRDTGTTKWFVECTISKI